MIFLAIANRAINVREHVVENAEEAYYFVTSFPKQLFKRLP